MRIALLPGHAKTREGSSMCCGHFKGYGEWALAAWYIPQLARGLRELGYDVVRTQREDAGGTTPSYSAKAANAVGADLALEFHFNSAGPKASGACCVCWKYSDTGRKFALEVAKGMAELIGIGLTADGVIVQPSDEERGLMAFKKSKMPFFMLEPCFAGSNETDCQLFTHALLSGEWGFKMPGIIDRCIKKVYTK